MTTPRAGTVPEIVPFAIRLHIPRSTPRIPIESADPILDSLLRNKQLPRVLAVKLILRRRIWTTGVLGRERIHVVAAAVWGRANSQADDAEARAGGGVEEQVEELPLDGCVLHVGDEIGALEGDAEAESRDGLVCGRRRHGDGVGLTLCQIRGRRFGLSRQSREAGEEGVVETHDERILIAICVMALPVE